MTRTMLSLQICESSISCSAKTIPSQPYFDADPGWRAEPEPGFPSTGFTPGKHLHFDILSGAPYGLPANLTYWDGTGSPHFGFVPNGETLTLDLAGGLADATAGSGNGFIPGYNIGTFDSTGDLHVHLGSFLQGSGGNNPANGIYMMVLHPSTDMPGIAAAQPIFVLWDNGLGDGDQLAAAVDYAQGHVRAGAVDGCAFRLRRPCAALCRDVAASESTSIGLAHDLTIISRRSTSPSAVPRAIVGLCEPQRLRY